MKQNKLKDKPRSILLELEVQNEKNKYLKVKALARGVFKTEDDLNEWYRCACLTKTLNPKIADNELMPIPLMKILKENGLIASDHYYVYVEKAD